jgi:hypothetical protein
MLRRRMRLYDDGDRHDNSRHRHDDLRSMRAMAPVMIMDDAARKHCTTRRDTYEDP